MESTRCPVPAGPVVRRFRRKLSEQSKPFLSIDRFSSRNTGLGLSSNNASSRQLQATSGPLNSDSRSGFNDDGARNEEDFWGDGKSTEQSKLPQGDGSDGQQAEALNDSLQWTDERERPQDGNGMAPGLLSSGNPFLGQAGRSYSGQGLVQSSEASNKNEASLPEGEMPLGAGTGDLTGTGKPEKGVRSVPGIPQPPGQPSQEALPRGVPPELTKRALGAFFPPGPPEDVQPDRPSSPVFSDVSDGDSPAAGTNGSWVGPPRVLTETPWSPDGVSLQSSGSRQTRPGPVKALGLGLRGRQSVMGSTTMQGSRFEAVNGDTSWINSMSPDWFPVTPLWQASDKAAMASEPFLTHMSQGWRVLLLSDGSVTRHLHLLTGHRVSVECLEMRPIGHSLLGVPPGTALVAGPRVQRQVLLKTKDGTPLAYAASWWAEYEAKMHLQETHTPIWVQLQEQRMELFRSLECLYYGHTREIERLFGKDGPFWARHYLFYHNGRPLTLIYEVFSPALDEWLGDSSLPEDLYLP